MRAALKLLPFFFVVAMTLIVLVFPEPEDMIHAFNLDRPVSLPNDVVASEDIDWKVTRPTSVAYTFDDFEDLGCTEMLAHASPQKLEVCSKVIAEAVIQVTQYEQAHGVETTTAERLLLAATHVCRAAWADSPSLAIDLNNPACAASTLRLASLN